MSRWCIPVVLVYLDMFLDVLFEPQDMAPDIEMLRGMAIQHDTGSQKLLKLFDVHQLPTEPAARFRAVFQEQAQWTLQALQPYIEDLQACLAYLLALVVLALTLLVLVAVSMACQ